MAFCEGSYLNAEVRIGSLVHNLTTDVLNHLVFVQKVFMKEVNEVLQKMTSGSSTSSSSRPSTNAKKSSCQGGKKKPGKESASGELKSRGSGGNDGEPDDASGLLYLFVVKFDVSSFCFTLDQRVGLGLGMRKWPLFDFTTRCEYFKLL